MSGQSKLEKQSFAPISLHAITGAGMPPAPPCPVVPLAVVVVIAPPVPEGPAPPALLVPPVEAPPHAARARVPRSAQQAKRRMLIQPPYHGRTASVSSFSGARQSLGARSSISIPTSMAPDPDLVLA
jgi:hypothetical protein